MNLIQSSCQLRWPIIEPTVGLNMPRPLFGNVQEYNVPRIQKTTLGGKLITKRKEAPISDLRKYKFQGLTKLHRDTFLWFVRHTFGKQVVFDDHEGSTLVGLIVNFGTTTQESRGSGYTAEFDLEVNFTANSMSPYTLTWTVCPSYSSVPYTVYFGPNTETDVLLGPYADPGQDYTGYRITFTSGLNSGESRTILTYNFDIDLIGHITVATLPFAPTYLDETLIQVPL